MPDEGNYAFAKPGGQRSYYKITRVEDGQEAIMSVQSNGVFHVREAKHDETDLSEFVNDWKSFHKLPRITSYAGGHSYRQELDPFAAAMARRKAKSESTEDISKREGDIGLQRSFRNFKKSVTDLQDKLQADIDYWGDDEGYQQELETQRKETENTVANFEMCYKRILPNLGRKSAQGLSGAKVVLHRSTEALNDQFKSEFPGLKKDSDATVGGWFNPNNRQLNLTYTGFRDGEEETIAHEISHAFDFDPDWRQKGLASPFLYSASSDWRKAWREEIGDLKREAWVRDINSASGLKQGTRAKDLKVGESVNCGGMYGGFREIESITNLPRNKVEITFKPTQIQRPSPAGTTPSEPEKLPGVSFSIKGGDVFLTRSSKDIDPARARLGSYATTLAEEGFAEFGALVLTDPEYAKQTCPKCWAVWEKFKLINPDAKYVRTRRNFAFNRFSR